MVPDKYLSKAMKNTRKQNTYSRRNVVVEEIYLITVDNPNNRESI